MFTLGRMLDFNYRTNKLILSLVLLAAAAAWALTGGFLASFYIGMGVFLTWALSRELDPKHEYSAFAAVLFSLFNLFSYESIQLAVILWIVMLTRMVSGTTGEKLTILDLFLGLSFTVYLSLDNKNGLYLLIFILVLLFIMKVEKRTGKLLVTAGIGLILFIIQGMFIGYFSLSNTDYLSPINLFFITVVCLSFIFFWFFSKEDAKDDKGNKLSRFRLLAGRFFYSIAILLLFFFSGISQNTLTLYLSAILGIASYFIISNYLIKHKDHQQ